MTAFVDSLTEFERARPRMFGIAYRMLGDVHDAEDLVQDAWLRWQGVDHAALESPTAWLVAVVTRLSIDRLRRARTERVEYVGQWLPEPVATAGIGDPARGTELESDLSMAFLVLLERLGEEERAAFLLREVFDAGYDEIAAILERTPAAVRQLVHRAHERVRADRARFAVAPDARARLLDAFLSALRNDDRDALLALFSEDVTFTTDGGGKAPAARRVIHGADHVIRFLLGLEGKWGDAVRHELVVANGELVMLSSYVDLVIAVTAFAVDGNSGRVAAAYRVMNPDKLTRLGRAVVSYGAAETPLPSPPDW